MYGCIGKPTSAIGEFGYSREIVENHHTVYRKSSPLKNPPTKSHHVRQSWERLSDDYRLALHAARIASPHFHFSVEMNSSAYPPNSLSNDP